ncbi:RNA polymerase sigma-70 factor [Aquimarina sp. D1M17]|uniref:RNA polymerase sigma-70 factor n=1 Tax=Aquimarina acroporae TaxID=2937283 RepID=UPI0020BEBDAA|nr:RNA polymerase sigma-70 factor [Aquimarina acroporae]MCK8524269.1 RNA polymerase sigma-70 factor [Aquimarina acroporae]
MKSITSDQLIIEQIRNKNEKVFESVFKEYFKVLTIHAKKYVLDLDIAKDITQETFVKLYEKREELVIHTSLKSFLYTAVRNRCLDYIKLNKIRQNHKDAIAYQSATNSEEEEEDKEIRITELKQKIHKVIQTLPSQNQKIFMLSRFEGKTNQEIADELNISKRTVETHISNALKKIRVSVAIALLLLFLSFL